MAANSNVQVGEQSFGPEPYILGELSDNMASFG